MVALLAGLFVMCALMRIIFGNDTSKGGERYHVRSMHDDDKGDLAWLAWSRSCALKVQREHGKGDNDDNDNRGLFVPVHVYCVTTRLSCRHLRRDDDGIISYCLS